MDLMEEYTNNLYELVKSHFGSRFLGYSFLDGSGNFLSGNIEGRIDLKQFSLHINQSTISFHSGYECESAYGSGKSLIAEMKQLVLSTFNEDDIRSHTGFISFEDNLEEFDIHLNYRIDLGKEHRFDKPKTKNKTTKS